MKYINKRVKGIDPVADAFAGTVSTEIVSMRNYAVAEFTRYDGVGTTGTSTVTVEACDDTTPSNTSAIPFLYQEVLTGDTPGVIKQATATGFATTAGSSQMYRIWAHAGDLAASGFEFVRATFVEVANSPVLGGVLIELKESKFDAEVPATAIV